MRTGHIRSSASRTSGDAQDARPDLARFERRPGAVGQRADHLRLDEPTAGVVDSGTRRRASCTISSERCGRERQRLEPVTDAQRRAQAPLAVAHRLDQHAGHALVALDPSDRRAIVAPDGDAVDEIGEHGQFDTGFSPSDGSTCSMYARNKRFGPTTSTP